MWGILGCTVLRAHIVCLLSREPHCMMQTLCNRSNLGKVLVAVPTSEGRMATMMSSCQLDQHMLILLPWSLFMTCSVPRRWNLMALVMPWLKLEMYFCVTIWFIMVMKHYCYPSVTMLRHQTTLLHAANITCKENVRVSLWPCDAEVSI